MPYGDRSGYTNDPSSNLSSNPNLSQNNTSATAPTTTTPEPVYTYTERQVVYGYNGTSGMQYGQTRPPAVVLEDIDKGSNDTIAEWFSTEQGKQFLDQASGVPPERVISPLSYEDYISYEHRINDTTTTIRIGDCHMVVPPDFIAIKEIKNTEQIVSLRQTSSMKDQHGYSRKEVTITAFFNGKDQINGYPVPSPFDRPYYVDGLRPLLAQFKCTPFLPVENFFLNYTNDIWNLALQSITVNTVQGFPNVLQVTIVANEFNAVPYLETANFAMSDSIDWDLFRYYYQQLMNEKETNANLKDRILSKSSAEGDLNEAFEISVLDLEKIQGENFNESMELTDDLFEIMISNRGDAADSFVVTEMNFGVSNILSFLQLSAHDSPTMQYLGGSDTMISFNIETTSEVAVRAFRELLEKSKKLILGSRQTEGIGVLKVKNDVLNILGTQYLMANNCVITTVPDFPGKYNIYLECLSYDMRTKEREELNGFRPFFKDGEGRSYDTLPRSPKGLKNKIIQEAMAEAKIGEMELYPDLFLPYYAEVDDALEKIRSFRLKNNLTAHPFTGIYPRKMPKNALIGKDGYAKFVDPDFYMMYPFDYGSMEDTLDLPAVAHPKPDITDLTLDYEISASSETTNGAQGSLALYSTDGTGYAKYSRGRQAFLAYLMSEVGQGYVYGTSGQLLTNDLLRSKQGQYPSINRNISKWLGKRVYDCSGFVSWALVKIGLYSAGFRSTAAVFGTNKYCTTISKSELIPGDLVSTSKHVAVFIGDGKTVEAANTSDGVKYGVVGNRFTNFTRINGLDNVKIEGSVLSAGAEKPRAPHDTTQSSDADVRSYQPSKTSSTDTSVLGKFNDTRRDQFDSLIIKYAKQHDLNPNWMKALMQQESNMNPESINSLPAVGLLQLTKSVFSEYNIPFSIEKAKNPEFNIELGFRYAKKCLGMLENNYEYMVQGYNMGPYGFKKYLAGERSLPKETKIHIEKIRGYYNQLIKNGGTSTSSSSNTTSTSGTTTYSVQKKHGDRSGQFSGEFGQPLIFRSPVNVLVDKEESMGKFSSVFSMDKGLLKECISFIMMDKSAKTLMEKQLSTLNGNIWGIDKALKENDADALGVGLEKIFKDAVVGTITDIDNAIKASISLSINLVKKVDDAEKVAEEIIIASINAPTDAVQMALTPDGKLEGYSKHVDLGSDYANSSIPARSTVDMVNYSNKRTLLRAFPTYAFLIIDDSSDWMDGKKLWNNYYNYKSVVSIQVHSEKSQPVKTAVLTVTNINKNLEKIPKIEYIKKGIEDDKGYNPVVRWLFKNTGIFIGGLKVTEQAIDEKNKLVPSVKLEAGSRIHIRMGYGSNPSMLPVAFNGTVTEMSAGNVITMIAQSDGIELINNVVTTKKDDTNKGSLLQKEGSDIISSLLTDKENIFMNMLNSKWGEKNRYGIEHFGHGCVEGANIGPERQYEYDICKNIYLSKYKQKLLCSNDAWFGADGEKNLQMFLYNKTPWDIMQNTVQTMPEFLCQPMEHQFDTRLFYGLPGWNVKYRYDYNSSDRTIYEHSKAFSQFHLLDSVGDIIDNRIVCTDKKLYSNVIAMYTVAGDFRSSPVLYADKNIEWSKQKTKVVDTTIMQDYLGPDALYGALLGMKQGKENAINVGISNLLDSYEQMYANELIVVGDPSIKPCDNIMIQDFYGDMSGMATVRSVTHSFSMETGLTTSITPGLISYSKTKDAGSVNFHGSLMSLGTVLGGIKVSRWVTIGVVKKYGQVMATAKMVKTVAVIKDVYSKVKSSTIVINSAAKAAEWASTIYEAANAGKTGNQIQKVAMAAQGTWSLAGGAKGVGAFMSTTLPTAAIYVAVTIIFNSVLEATIDYFSYNNCVGIRPLVHKNRFFVTRTKGQRALIDGTNNGSDSDIMSLEDDDMTMRYEDATILNENYNDDQTRGDLAFAEKYAEAKDNTAVELPVYGDQ